MVIQMCFLTPHTTVKHVTVSTLLKKASETFGIPGAVPSANFIRKLFGSLTPAGQKVVESEWQRAVNDLASIDAHTAKVALSRSYNVSDRVSKKASERITPS